MAKFRVVEEFEVEGTLKEVGLELELSDEQAAELGSKVEALVESEEGDSAPMSGAVSTSTSGAVSGSTSTSGESTSGATSGSVE